MTTCHEKDCTADARLSCKTCGWWHCPDHMETFHLCMACAEKKPEGGDDAA